MAGARKRPKNASTGRPRTKTRATSPAAIAAALRAHALGLPGSVEERPWGERVAKIGGKVFVFFGREDHPDGLCFSVKLPESHATALKRPDCAPTGYGLGKHRWVTVRVGDAARAALESFRAWIHESYRAVAPRRMLKELDEPR